jgi:hypothetical protein
MLSVGSRSDGRALPGSPCYWKVTTVTLSGYRSLSRGVRCEMLLTSPKTVCAWWRTISYMRWPCYAEHSRSIGVNLEKQSPILRCERRAQGMNGSGLVCLERHPWGNRPHLIVCRLSIYVGAPWMVTKFLSIFEGGLLSGDSLRGKGM